MPAKKKKTPALKSIQRSNTRAVRDLDSSAGQAPSNRFNKKNILLLLLCLLILFLLYYFKGIFIAATVNGRPISRLELIKELEQQEGKKVLDSLITKSIVEEAAKKQNLTISDSELNDEISKIEKSLKAQGQDFNQALSAQGLTRETLKERVKLRKIVEKLFAKDLQITDKEVQDFIEKNKENIPEGISDSEIAQQVKSQLGQEKLDQKFQSWITDTRSKAKINYFKQY